MAWECIYIYIYIHIYLYICAYICIVIHHVYTYIYIYVYFIVECLDPRGFVGEQDIPCDPRPTVDDTNPA